MCLVGPIRSLVHQRPTMPGETEWGVLVSTQWCHMGRSAPVLASSFGGGWGSPGALESLDVLRGGGGGGVPEGRGATERLRRGGQGPEPQVRRSRPREPCTGEGNSLRLLLEI